MRVGYLSVRSLTTCYPRRFETPSVVRSVRLSRRVATNCFGKDPLVGHRHSASGATLQKLRCTDDEGAPGATPSQPNRERACLTNMSCRRAYALSAQGR